MEQRKVLWFLFAVVLIVFVPIIGNLSDALDSKAVDAACQGELKGATQAIGSIAQSAGPPMYAGIFARSSGAGPNANFAATPLVVSAAIAIEAGGIAFVITRPARR